MSNYQDALEGFAEASLGEIEPSPRVAKVLARAQVILECIAARSEIRAADEKILCDTYSCDDRLWCLQRNICKRIATR